MLDGMDKFKRNSKRLQQNAAALEKGQNVSFADLFPDTFIRTHSSFSSMQEMIDAAGIKNPEEELKGEVWSQFVSTHTRFKSWQEMLEVAGTQYLQKQLFQGI